VFTVLCAERLVRPVEIVAEIELLDLLPLQYERLSLPAFMKIS
jgi:hypothetical protein